ncbi:polysaccharide biosynthesis C-terminal domain-containing protein [Tepidibacter aestuarii]|uniref:polysaccharide biosynthesis C-terminal domain-containing protein n=1 Tax=Tepidibacter aestuarii TaxID=2925782 RepID=UPI0020C1834F|nr:NAD-dependent epimerase/dehydratase family protein [Tepidibacter aestuarii]CAH2214319.1 UDP-2-acetamido-2,6-beta-L-arabino-hexul-4-ose reductase [Tepidibacter aestuarii]
MKNILVTGYNGFIGKNLLEALNRMKGLNILKYGKDDTKDKLKEYIEKADFIYHIAGINAPKNISEFQVGNVDLTKSIVETLKKLNKNTPILIISSVQAKLDNPFGISKKKAEDIIIEYREKTGANVYIYRLGNVFGKWSKPNYNSPVATYCNNISKDLQITMPDKNRELELVYIEDLIDKFLSHIYESSDDIYYNVNPTYKITIKELVDSIYKIRKNVESLIMPNIESDLMKKLYATYISFLDPKYFSYELKEHKGKEGKSCKFIKSKQFGQISLSTINQRCIRGNHYHNTKAEKICVVKGRALIKLKNIDTDEVVEYYLSGQQFEVVDIPVGYIHSIENLLYDELILLIWDSQIYDDKKPDTYYCEV